MELFTYTMKMEAACPDKTLVPTYQAHGISFTKFWSYKETLRLDMGKINCIKAYWSAYFSTIIKCCEKYKIKEPEFQVIWSNPGRSIIVVKTSITLNFKLHMPEEPVFTFSL